jgi:toxin-antitoxin system PIN domain toxin
MQLPDVNVLVDAFREDSPSHELNERWLSGVVNGPEAYGISDVVCTSFLRIVTNPRIFKTPSPFEQASAFVERVRNQPHCLSIAPGERHWGIFLDLCRSAAVRGNLITDAYFAALAIESGSEWITQDRDFARFPGLRWRPPS